MSGRFAYKGQSVPPFFGIVSGGVQRVASSGGVPSVPIDLSNIFSRCIELVAVSDIAQYLRRPSRDFFVVAIGDRHKDAGVSVGGRTKNQAVFADPDSPGVVVRRADKFELGNLQRMLVEIIRGFFRYFSVFTELVDRRVGVRGSRFDCETPKALAESLLSFAVDHGSRIVVALHSPDPVVESQLEIANAPVGVSHPPAGDQFLFEIGDIIPVNVLQKEGLGSVLDQGSAPDRSDRCGNAHALGEDGELIGLAVPVGIFADANAVATCPERLEFVGIIDRFADPKTSFAIPVHGDGFSSQTGDAQIGFSIEGVFFAGPEFCFKTLWGDVVFLGFDGRQRHLHAAHRFGLSVASTWLVVRNLLAHFGEGKGCDVFTSRSHLGDIEASGVLECREFRRVLLGRPSDPTRDEILETWIAPCVHIMAPSRIEDPSFAMRADPGPRLSFGVGSELSLAAFLQDRAILGVVHLVNIGFVPAFKAAETLHDRVLWLENMGHESLAAVLFELSADEFDIGLRVAETKRRAVQRYDSVS